MSLKVNDAMIYNEDDQIVGTVIGHVTRELRREIELGSELIPEVENFIQDVNSGKLKARTVTKKFEALLEKHKI